ncbi:MAG: hypothetical protein WCD29_18430, partial [Pseudolabrys sp.]
PVGRWFESGPGSQQNLTLLTRAAQKADIRWSPGLSALMVVGWVAAMAKVSWDGALILNEHRAACAHDRK